MFEVWIPFTLWSLYDWKQNGFYYISLSNAQMLCFMRECSDKKTTNIVTFFGMWIMLIGNLSMQAQWVFQDGERSYLKN